MDGASRTAASLVTSDVYDTSRRCGFVMALSIVANRPVAVSAEPPHSLGSRSGNRLTEVAEVLARHYPPTGSTRKAFISQRAYRHYRYSRMAAAAAE